MYIRNSKLNMKTPKKIIVCILLFGLTIQSQFFWYTYAWCYEMHYWLYEWNENCVQQNQNVWWQNQNRWWQSENNNSCAACKSTPAAMQTFINFEVELLWILQSANWQAETFWTNKTSWLFAWWLLTLPATFLKSTIEKTKTDLDSEIKAVRAVRIATVLLTTMTTLGIKDSRYSIQILLKNESYVRDYKILQELDMSINDVIRDMWISWIWDSHVSSSVKNEILALQNKYSQENPIFTRLSISSDVRYKQLLIFLLRLNSNMKSMLMSLGENTPILEASVLNFENDYSKWNIIVEINREYIESIKRDYSCISYSVCNQTVKEALEWLLNYESFLESFSRTKDTIKDANQNLKDAYLWNSNSKNDYEKDWIWWLTDRQVELLYTVYGIDAHNLTSSQIETLKKNFEQMKKEVQPVVDGYKDATVITQDVFDTSYTAWKWTIQLIWYWFNRFKNRFNKIMGKWEEQEWLYRDWLSDAEKKELLNQIYTQKSIPMSETWEALINTLQNSIIETLIEKWKDKENLSVWINQDTHFFVEIGGYIHSIVKDEIWDKDSEWLVKILWEVCEYQCKNHWGKCYSD